MTIFVPKAETRILCSGHFPVASPSKYLLNLSCRKTSATSWRMQPPVDTRPSPTSRERKAALTLRWKGGEVGADCCLLSENVEQLANQIT